MTERNCIPQPDERFGDIYESKFLKPGTEIQLPGDPPPEDFASTQAYLETITDRLLKDGVWEKQPADIIDELAYQNECHKAEVEAERKAGEKQAEYREVNLQSLATLSKRRLLAFQQMGWEVTHDFRVIQYIDSLVNRALQEQEQEEQLMAIFTRTTPPVEESASSPSDDVPF